MSKWPVVKLGELCLMEKGISPTLKTPSGEYPLVVTAEFRRTANSWQIQGPAVCIPLVSSTGHGDAAIHRVHYQEGKFALANLLVALLPKDPNCCNAKYIYYLLMVYKDSLLVPLMRGSANVALKTQDIANVEIPLPPLAEQQRIVARIEELIAKINEAKELRKRANGEKDALLRSILMSDNTATPTVMRKLVNLRSPDILVHPDEMYQFAGVYSFGRGVFKADRKSGADFAYPRLTKLKVGEFVYPKLMAWEGALGVVPSECDGFVVSTEFSVFTVNEERVLPEVLDIYFRTPSVWQDLAGESTGTNVRRRRLNPNDFLNFIMPLPSQKTQVMLRKVKEEVDTLKHLQAETSAKLDALLPAVLDRAFKGEL